MRKARTWGWLVLAIGLLACTACTVTPEQAGDYIMDVVRHLLGTTDGVALLAAVAVAAVKAAGMRDARIEAVALRVFNIVEKLGRLDPKLDKVAKFAELWVLEYQKETSQSPSPHANKVATKLVERTVEQANRSRLDPVKLLQLVAALKNKG